MNTRMFLARGRFFACGSVTAPSAQTPATRTATPRPRRQVRAGLVKNVRGDVAAWRQSGQRCHPARHLREQVAPTDRVVTGPDSGASVVLRDGTTLVVGPASQLDLKEFSYESTTQDGGMLVRLGRGSLRMITGLLGKAHPDAVRVETQTATIGIRGNRLHRRGGADTVILKAVASGFALPWPARSASPPAPRALPGSAASCSLPQEDGTPSAVVVHSKGGEQTLAQPFERATAAVGASGPPVVDQVDPVKVRKANGTLFDMAPPKAQRYTLYFEAGGTALAAVSQQDLQDLLTAAVARSGGDILVTGHTDTTGAAAQNDALSLERASQVRDMLVKRGFPPTRHRIRRGRGLRELAAADRPRRGRTAQPPRDGHRPLTHLSQLALDFGDFGDLERRKWLMRIGARRQNACGGDLGPWHAGEGFLNCRACFCAATDA